MSNSTSASYTQDELMSATEIVRHFGSVLGILRKRKQKKIGILRKNKIEAVIIPAEEYDHFERNASLLKELMLYVEVEKRSKTPKKEFIDFEQILNENNISL